MGWLSKGIAALVATLLFGTGLWWLGAIIIVYLLYSLRPKREKFQQTVVIAQPGQAADGTTGPQQAPKSRFPGLQWRWRYILGGVFLFGALLGIGARGTYSPAVFGGLGLLCILWSPLSARGFLPRSRHSAMHESTLLRSSILPVSWMTVAELKLSSQESARALSALWDDLVITAPAGDRPTAYLLPKVVAFGYKQAESKMAEKLRSLGALLANRGVYLLPLDSKEAVRRFGSALKPVRMDLNHDTILEVVGHYQYEVLVARSDGIHVRSLGVYRLSQGKNHFEPLSNASTPSDPGPITVNKKADFPVPRQSFARKPLLWEVISSLQERYRFAEPDGYTMFLNNMHLSRAVSPGGKMTLASGSASSAGGGLMAESVGGAPVEMTLAQVRTIVRIYG